MQVNIATFLAICMLCVQQWFAARDRARAEEAKKEADKAKAEAAERVAATVERAAAEATAIESRKAEAAARVAEELSKTAQITEVKLGDIQTLVNGHATKADQKIEDLRSELKAALAVNAELRAGGRKQTGPKPRRKAP